MLRVSLRGRERGRVSSSLRAAFRLPVLLFFFSITSFSFAINLSLKFACLFKLQPLKENIRVSGR